MAYPKNYFQLKKFNEKDEKNLLKTNDVTYILLLNIH